MGDVNGDYFFHVVSRFFPDDFVNFVAGKNPCLVFHKKAQNFVLVRRQIRHLSVHPHFLGIVVQADASHGVIAVVDFRRTQRGVAAYALIDPGDEFDGVKGLDNVIVGAHVQADDLVGDFALCTKDNDGDIAGLAYF